MAPDYLNDEHYEQHGDADIAITSEQIDGHDITQVASALVAGSFHGVLQHLQALGMPHDGVGFASAFNTHFATHWGAGTRKFNSLFTDIQNRYSLIALTSSLLSDVLACALNFVLPYHCLT